MSQRVKRPNRSEDGSVPVKRRKRTAAEEEEAASLAGTWQPRSNDNRIYNRTTTEAPAELFRKDLISAMKLPDSEPLASDEYWVIVDQWKQEWERGVQVPVNPDSLPEPSVSVIRCNSLKMQHEFKLPKNKYIRITKDENFKTEEHHLSNAPALSEAACSYDLDECDVSWLKLLNAERAAAGLGPIYEDQLERVIERFELCCWDKIQAILRNEEGLGIEFDENVICDVCRSPDSEEGNEMVFCDSCNICVHQACYGITRIPKGDWLCCTCNLGQRPECVLCPNKGGAMKCTRSGQKWAHVSCALWIPEVSIGCVEKMEPITKISSIPSSRWALICVLCRERVGACIQCSVKTCKTAYHVTCAFKHGLEMRAIIEDENADDGVKLRSYCEKHSKSSKKEKSVCSGSEDDDSKRKKRKDMTSEEKNQARAARLQEIEAEFYKHVTVKDVSIHLDVDNEALQYIYNYWKLKRKAGLNKPLLPPKSEDVDVLSHKREQADMEKMKLFVQLRQDLERVRNLCYMVSRREKLSRTFFRTREQTFHKQVAVLDSANQLPNHVVQAVIEANHGPSIYDRLYSHNEAEDHTSDFDSILARIAGIKTPSYSGDEKKPEINGLLKEVKNSPYKRVYYNGSAKRGEGIYGSSASSSSSSDEKPKENKENRLHSSSEDDKPSISSQIKKKTPSSSRKSTTSNKALDKRRSKLVSTRSKGDSSSEEEAKPAKKDWKLSKSGLMKMEHELGDTGSESDELLPICTTQKSDNQNMKSMSSIYSDSDSSDVSMRNDDKSSVTSDSQNKLRTKASVKEFSHKPSTSKSPNKSSPENKKKNKADDGSKKDSKKKDYVPSDLIVPQRQAAKKATENLKSTTSRVKEQPSSVEEALKADEKLPKVQKSKQKSKDLHKDQDVSKKKETKLNLEEFNIDKELEKIDNSEILGYVPQRQAAKKAAEHIKSGLGKPVAANEATEGEKTKKDIDYTKTKGDNKSSKVDITKRSESETEKPAKIAETKRKSSSNSSSSSSSTSSSSSSSSSSSDSEEESPNKQTPPPAPRSESLFSSPPRETTKRSNAKDWPFLDKVSKAEASSSSSDSSDSSAPNTPRKSSASSSAQPKTDSPSRTLFNAKCHKSTASRKSSDKKSSTTPTKREEPLRPRGRGRTPRGRVRTSNSGDRVGDANVRLGNTPERQRVSLEGERNKGRKGKHSEDEIADITSKEISQSGKLFSPVRKTDKKLDDIRDRKFDSETNSLEKEILERKAGKEGSSKSKSKLDRLFGSPEKRDERGDSESPNRVRTDKNKYAEEFNKSPSKKSPIKNKCIDDIFAHKSNRTNENKEKHLDSFQSPSKHSVNKVMEEITLADKIVEDHLQSHKSREINKSQINEKLPFCELDFNRKSTNRQSLSHFSPTPEFDLDDNFGIPKEEEIIKGSSAFNFGSNVMIKEDTKEDSARETLNLVEKLRLGMSKKSTSCDVDDAATSTENESERNEFTEQVVPDNNIQNSSLPLSDAKSDVNLATNVNLEMKIQVSNASNAQYHQQRNDRYRYMNCEADVPLESSKNNIPSMQHHHNSAADPNISVQGDERWVPPSESYPNVQSADPASQFLNEENLANIDPHYVQQQQQYPNNDQEHHKSQQSSLNSLHAQLDVRMHDDGSKNQSPSVHDRRISQTPLIDPTSMDCMNSPATVYGDAHPQVKWTESEMMPNRRSSSSSAASTSSSCSRRNDQDEDPKMRPDLMVVNHSALEYLPPQIPPPAFPPASALDNFAAYSEASQFVSPVSLFPPPLNTQLSQFPSTGSAMFPPPFGAPFPTPHSIPTLPKPVEETLPYPSTCTAAFTSSQHNMALTAAMVNIPSSTPKLPDQLAMDDNCTVNTPSETILAPQPEPSPALSNSAPTVNSALPSPSPSLKSNSSAGKKSPSKPTRTSARVTSQQLNKSPSKSPGKSPRQQDIIKQSGPGRGRGDGKRSSGKSSSRSGQSQQRGRGRGRGRSRGGHHADMEYFGANTIHNKLVGTVYDLDFDDDISNDNMKDLKSMRERRKSVDVHERKYDSYLSKDSSHSPKFSSPSQTSSKNRSYNADLRELRPPTPIEDSRSKSELSVISNESDVPKIFPEVAPMLPGPVDMRTYNSNFELPTYNESNLLNAFASGTTETNMHDEIDEDFEKELHSALSTKTTTEPSPPKVSNIKVSLSDSRNQLKVKIKGPIANYTSTVAPLPPPTVDLTAVPNINSNAGVNNAINSASMSSGSSSLRRMRKKELLIQYVQNMNTDDPTNTASGYNAMPTVQPVNRAITTTITIPKAVASMTSIPTKDDYRDYRTDDMESKHHRKDSKSRPGMGRELRQLDLSLDEDGMSERRRSVGSVGSNNSNLSTSFDSALANKKRGRPPRPSAQPTAPKLKIKLGPNAVATTATKIDDKKDRIRPPKKRLTTMNMPSVEDLKRESMKFRKMVMQDLKVKKKKDKSEKKKKKKNKSDVQIVSNQSENPTKLIFRFNKPTGNSDDKRTETSGSSAVPSANNAENEKSRTKNASSINLVADKSKSEAISDEPAPIKPIKLKLSRCQEGSGYVMKASTSQSAKDGKSIEKVPPPPPSGDSLPLPLTTDKSAANKSESNSHQQQLQEKQKQKQETPSPPLNLPDAVQPTPLPLNKDCEVR